MTLRIGTAGVPRSAKGSGTEDGIRRIRELGLDHMEIEWVHGVRVSPKKAESIRATAEENDVTLTAHGPYYINLNSLEPQKVEASIKRILNTARTGQLCGAKSVLFHAAFMMKMDPVDVYINVRDRLKEIVAILKKEKITVDVRCELVGKPSQWGSLEELIRISKDVPGIKPAIDFSHQHARTGAYNSYEEFSEILKTLQKGLGKKFLKDMHMHVSGIEYTPKGERKHLNFKEADFKWREFIRALYDHGVEGYLVCESPNLEEDALLLKKAYQKLEKDKKKKRSRINPPAGR